MLKDKSLKTKHQIVIQWLCSGSLDIHLVPRQEKKEKIGGFERAMGIQHRGRVDVSYCKDTFILYFACIFCMHRFYPLPVAVCLYAPLGSGSAPGQFDYSVIMTGKYMSTGLRDSVFESSKVCVTNFAHTPFPELFNHGPEIILKEERILSTIITQIIL